MAAPTHPSSTKPQRTLSQTGFSFDNVPSVNAFHDFCVTRTGAGEIRWNKMLTWVAATASWNFRADLNPERSCAFKSCKKETTHFKLWTYVLMLCWHLILMTSLLGQLFACANWIAAIQAPDMTNISETKMSGWQCDLTSFAWHGLRSPGMLSHKDLASQAAKPSQIQRKWLDTDTFKATCPGQTHQPRPETKQLTKQNNSQSNWHLDVRLLSFRLWQAAFSWAHGEKAKESKSQWKQERQTRNKAGGSC